MPFLFVKIRRHSSNVSVIAGTDTEREKHMEASITIKQLLEVIAALVAIWGGYKVVLEIIEKINTKHDQIQKWDEYDKQIKAIKEEQCLLTFGMLATLDGLKQLNCNGKVTEARDKIDRHLNKTAHGVDI